MPSSNTCKLFVIANDDLSMKFTNALELSCHRVAVAGLEAWQKRVETTVGCIGILDIRIYSSTLANRLKAVSTASRSPSGPIMFALLPCDQANWSQAMLPTGFASAFHSMSHRSQFIKYATKHFNSAAISEAGIEEAVSDNLPWSP